MAEKISPIFRLSGNKDIDYELDAEPDEYLFFTIENIGKFAMLGE